MSISQIIDVKLLFENVVISSYISNSSFYNYSCDTVIQTISLNNVDVSQTYVVTGPQIALSAFLSNTTNALSPESNDIAH